MKRRKDIKGRVLKDGESYRKSDERYMFRYTSNDGKRHTIYDSDLNKLREKEDKIRHDLREGIRLGECKRAHNIEIPKRHALTIPQQEAFIRYTGKCYFSVTTTKTEAGSRIIPMLQEVRQALLDEKMHQKEVGLTCQAVIEGYTDFVFLNRFGNPHNPQTINRTIKRITIAYNEEEMELAAKEGREPVLIPPFSCHNLRHTFCTRYCENETNLKVIQEIMGHRDIATTMDIYAEATKDVKVKLFQNLEGKIRIS